MKIVLDTNILLSSIFGSGAPCRLVQEALNKNFDIITSKSILNEVRKVLQDPEEKFQLSEQETDDIIAGILIFAKVVPLKTEIAMVRDPKDNHVISCAIDGQAEYIITRDKDLLSLISYKEIKIILPEEFLKLKI